MYQQNKFEQNDTIEIFGILHSGHDLALKCLSTYVHLTVTGYLNLMYGDSYDTNLISKNDYTII